MNVDLKSLLLIIKSSARTEPANKLALGVAGIGATAALIVGISKDIRVAVFGIIVIICFMTVLLILDWAKTGKRAKQRALINFFLWSVLIAFFVVVFLLITTFAFGWPRHATTMLFGSTKKVGIDPLKTEVAQLVQRIKSIDSLEISKAFDSIRRYLERHGLSSAFLDDASRWSSLSIYADMFNRYAIISTMEQYNRPGFIVFLDSLNDKIVLLDKDFRKGISKVKSVHNYSSSPQVIIAVMYITITGTGTYGKSVRFYTIDNDHVLLSLDKPYFQMNSGWNAFENDPVVFKLRNDFIIRNGVYEIHTSGIVTVGEEGKENIRILPKEIYVWDQRSKQFEQTEGRLTHKAGLLTSIYSDFADPKGDWFTKPRSLGSEENFDFVDEAW